ncbi:methylosome protein 50 isoform X2 [Rhipicephalus sanguineus]|uniref:methylosome protein 50 isoform X2 n=1 Tax=Rhipicephalus sanguineus TaxID=34632 RepID=UPI0020C367DE|nr:methylosome protein 50 isoform X2 [Rhipicephalus sanguineus]
MASVPCDTFHRNIDDIKRCKDDSLVLACNNLYGTKWEGSVRIYEKREDIPSLEKCVASVNTDSTVADIVPLNPGRFMLGLDSGGVEMIQLAQEEPRLLDTVFYKRDHDSGVTSLALSPDGRWLASTGWDYAIKVWDMSSMECSKTYVTAHCDAVWKVVFSTDPNVFLSCSKDRKVKSWDMRLSKPATVLGQVCWRCALTTRLCEWLMCRRQRTTSSTTVRSTPSSCEACVGRASTRFCLLLGMAESCSIRLDPHLRVEMRHPLLALNNKHISL